MPHTRSASWGFARNWDDKYWFDHLTVRKDDGDLTAVTMNEYTELHRIVAHQTK